MRDPADLEIGLCWGTLQNFSLIELIEAAGRHGFPTLAVRPDMVIDCGLSEAELRRRLADARVRVRVIDALGGGMPGMAQRTAVALAEGRLPPADQATCFRIAESVECPIVNVSLWGGEPAPLAALVDAIGAASVGAAARGLDLVLEFVPGTAIPDIGFARAIVEGCGQPNCRILLDPWHLVRSGGGLTDVEALPPGMLGAFQLDDRTEPAPGTPYVPMTGRDLPGSGELPLHAITRAALDCNQDLTAEIEVFSEFLRGLSVDEAAAHVARSVALWRRGFDQVER